MPTFCWSPRLLTARRTTAGEGQVLKASAIVNNDAKHNNSILAEGTLSTSSARLDFSNVAQQQYNKSHIALSYVKTTDTRYKGHV